MGEIFWGILRIWVVHATTLMFGDCSTRSTHLERCGHLGREIYVGKGSRRQWKYVLFQQNLCRSLSVSLSSTLLSQLSVCFVFFFLPKKSHQIEYLVQCGPAIALCRMQLFSRPQKQQLHYHMGNREVNQPTPGSACLFVSVYSCNGSIITHQQLLQYIERYFYLFWSKYMIW